MTDALEDECRRRLSEQAIEIRRITRKLENKESCTEALRADVIYWRTRYKAARRLATRLADELEVYSPSLPHDATED